MHARIRPRRGFGLIETLLSTVLLGILMTLLFAILIPMLRASSKGNNQSDLRQMCVVGLEVVARAVEQTSAPGLSLYTPSTQLPLALSVHEVADLAVSGQTIWDNSVLVFYWDKDQARLFDLRFPSAPTAIVEVPTQSQPYRWSLPNLMNVIAGNSPRHTLATDVKNFEVTGVTSHGVVLPVQINLALQRVIGNDVHHFQLTVAASPRIKAGR